MDPGFVTEVQALAAALDQLDYFGVLKLPQGAGHAEIKAAYYRESRAFHPDRFAAYPDPAVRELVGRVYRRVNEAYTVLRDDKRRVKYLQDISGPERARKLRFTEADEAQVKEGEKKSKLRVRADRVKFLSPPKSRAEAGGVSPHSSAMVG